MFENIYNKNKLEFESTVRAMVDDQLDPLLEYLSKTDFYYTPAAKSHHENYPGGLYDHCKSVFSELYSFRKRMSKNWTDLELLIIAFGHDLCKISFYIPTISENGVVTYSYNPEFDINRGHGTESLRILANIIPNLINKRVAESIVCHMGLWTKDIPNIGDHMLTEQSEDDIIFFTHCADMIASRVGKSAKLVKVNNLGEIEVNY